MGGSTRICLLSSFRLLNTTYVRYLMGIWCIIFIVLLIIDLEGGGVCRFARKLMLLVCMAHITLW